jgi:hypothetical protein
MCRTLIVVNAKIISKLAALLPWKCKLLTSMTFPLQIQVISSHVRCELVVLHATRLHTYSPIFGPTNFDLLFFHIYCISVFLKYLQYSLPCIPPSINSACDVTSSCAGHLLIHHYEYSNTIYKDGKFCNLVKEKSILAPSRKPLRKSLPVKHLLNYLSI